MITTDPRCGKRYRANDQDGHCTKCHRTWVGEGAFTLHQHLDGDGNLHCDDPETSRSPSGALKFGPRSRPGTTDGVAWGRGPQGGFPVEVFGGASRRDR